MKKNKIFKRPDRKETAVRIFSLVQWFVVIAGAAVGLFVHWKYSLCAVGFLLWNAFFYEKGCQEWVCDEWETGYPTQGLHRMFQSWIGAAIILAVVLFVIA